MIKVVVSGAAGKMGQSVCTAVEAADDMELVGRADPQLGSSLPDLLGGAEVVVDFTTPETVFENAKAALGAGVHVVIGTTGMSDNQLKELGDLAESGKANCFFAPNFATGAVMMMEAAKLVAKHMPNCEIVELHHDQKLDAPSGTAKRTAELIASVNGARTPPIHSVRLPGLVAHQEIIFGGQGETLTIRHDSISRESFMPGVLKAVRSVAELDGLVVGLEKIL